MKKILLILTLISCASFPLYAWDKKDKALIIGSISTLVAGELIRQAVLNNKSIINFLKDKPHVLIAGLGVSALAIRQYKNAVIDPIIEWYRK